MLYNDLEVFCVIHTYSYIHSMKSVCCGKYKNNAKTMKKRYLVLRISNCTLLNLLKLKNLNLHL